MKVTVEFGLPDDAEDSWDSVKSLAESVRATLHEINGDHGDVHVPVWMDVRVEVVSTDADSRPGRSRR